MIHPEHPNGFYDSFWGSKLYHSNRNKPSYFSGIISRKDIENTFSSHALYYYKDIVSNTYSTTEIESLLSGVKIQDERSQTNISVTSTVWKAFDNG